MALHYDPFMHPDPDLYGLWLLCSLLMIIQHVATFSYYSDIAISHLETMMFLKESFKVKMFLKIIAFFSFRHCHLIP